MALCFGLLVWIVGWAIETVLVDCVCILGVELGLRIGGGGCMWRGVLDLGVLICGDLLGCGLYYFWLGLM